MKSKLLRLLGADHASFVSGEEISKKLGISRVSVWKHIKKLQELGYHIESGPTGYCLIHSPDSVYPWVFPERENNIHYFPTVSSTMLEAKRLARDGCAHFSVVVADRQTEGRGRMKRRWISDEGGLYMTLILRPESPAVMMTLYSFAASLSLAETLQEDFKVPARVKWPNDILVEEKKICGMLAELEMEADRISFLNIGLGLNVNNDPTQKESNAISMKQYLGKTIPRKTVLTAFLDRLETELSETALDHIIPRWKQQTLTLNRQVRIVTTTGEWEGHAVDVDDTGALVLKLADQSLQKVYYGDCFHQATKDE